MAWCRYGMLRNATAYRMVLAGELAKVQEAADTERSHSFLSKLFRTDCYTEALHQLNVERCTELGSEQRTRLVRFKPSSSATGACSQCARSRCWKHLLTVLAHAQAMLMTNCQLSILGEVTFACRPDFTIKQCNEGMSSKAFDLFGNIFANVDRCAHVCAPWLPRDATHHFVMSTTSRVGVRAQHLPLPAQPALPAPDGANAEHTARLGAQC